MKNDKLLRSLWGIIPILSSVTNAKADRLVGVLGDTMVFSEYPLVGRFKYDFGKWCRFPLIRLMLPFLVFPWALLKYDVFHFFFNRGILPSWKWGGIHPFELFMLKLFKKRLFVYAFGGDVRTQEKTQALGKYNCCNHCPSIGRACVCDESKHQQNFARVKEYADEIFSMGDMTEYTPGSNNDLFYWPIDVQAAAYVEHEMKNSSTVKIVHAPNHRHFKGTDYLIKVVEKLKKEGHPIEIILVEKLSNEQALEIYRQADIVAEQFLIGWHGYTAIEAMALGKPVISYIRKPEYLLAPEECPIVSANPDDLEQALKDLITDFEKRRILGLKGRRYVEKYYSLEAFSERLRKVYERHGILA